MKTYLGDGVYFEFDGYQIVLTTEDGVRVTNTIYLEPDVYQNLVNAVDAVTKRDAPPTEIDPTKMDLGGM